MPPKQTQSQPQKKLPDELPRLRTFQSDVEELLRKENISKAAIALAEQEQERKRAEQAAKREPAQPLSESKVFHIESGVPLSARWNIGLIATVAIGFLLLGGVSAGAFFLLKSYQSARVGEPETSVPQSLAIDLRERAGRKEILDMVGGKIASISVPQNEARVIPIRMDGELITTSELFERIEVSAPSSLVRALEAPFTLGIHGFRGGQAFLILGVASYDYAFDGMLSWEKAMLEDIGPLFGILVKQILERPAATTNEALKNTVTVKDVVVRNKDTRVFLDPNGKAIFVYGFLDKETLILTTNADTFQFLMGKAEKGRLR